MGHSGTVPGAFKANQVSDALSNLQSGLASETSKSQSVNQDNDDDDEPKISLAKRAVPLINLLQAAIKKNCDVLWDFSKSP